MSSEKKILDPYWTLQHCIALSAHNTPKQYTKNYNKEQSQYLITGYINNFQKHYNKSSYLTMYLNFCISFGTPF